MVMDVGFGFCGRGDCTFVFGRVVVVGFGLGLSGGDSLEGVEDGVEDI